MSADYIADKLQLKKILDDAYYAGHRQVSDATYDALKDEIRELLEADPKLKKKYWDDFTATSFSRLENTFGDIKHDFPMTSLGKSNDINVFYKEMQKWKAAGSKNIVVMWKIDGSSSAYRYRNKLLTQVLTRHTGEFGKDITATAYQIENLPKSISSSDKFEVRGEMVIHEADFLKINEEREAKGLEPYQNARNAAAGVSQTKDAAKIRELRLSMIAYDILSQDVDFATHSEKLKCLKGQGFDTVEHHIVSTSISLEDLTKKFAAFEAQRFALGYEVDGLVAMVNEVDVREELGIKSNTPEYAFAFKFKDVEIDFIVDTSEYPHGIEWCFGSTGVLTPRAHFLENPKSQEILGVSIRHSNLHNVAELKRINWRIGTKTAIVKRAGLVIPKVVEALGAPESAGYPEPPKVCPVCGQPTGFKGEIFMCLNEDCEGKSFNRIRRFIRSMEIDDIGETTMQKISDAGLVRYPHELYQLKPEQLEGLDRLGKSSAAKIVKNIQASRNQPFWRVLDGLMITGLGTTISQKIAEKYPTWKEFFANVNRDSLLQLDKVGTTIADSIMTALSRQEIINVVSGLVNEGIGMTAEVKAAPINGALTGMTFCLTGSPELNGQKVKKAVVEEMITNAGGEITSMGKGLTYLVAGPDSIAEGSNKLEKAKKQGTKVITADELVKMIGV